MTFGVRKIDEEEIIYLLEIWPLDSLGTESIDSNAYFSPWTQTHSVFFPAFSIPQALDVCKNAMN